MLRVTPPFGGHNASRDKHRDPGAAVTPGETAAFPEVPAPRWCSSEGASGVVFTTFRNRADSLACNQVCISSRHVCAVRGRRTRQEEVVSLKDRFAGLIGRDDDAGAGP
jgi:hypothetical protein